MDKFNTQGGYFAPQGYMRVDEGGSHDENPNGGVQVGVDENGVPNLLEEGEPVYKDFVFSDNIEADAAFLEQYALPIKYAGKLYSKIADDILSEAEEQPYDPISANGLNAMLGRLAEAQEAQKKAEEEKELMEELSKLSPEELAELEEALARETTAGQEAVQMQQPDEYENVAPEEIAPYQPVMACGGLLNKFDGGGRAGREAATLLKEAGKAALGLMSNTDTNKFVLPDGTISRVEYSTVPILGAAPLKFLQKAGKTRKVIKALDMADTAYEAAPKSGLLKKILPIAGISAAGIGVEKAIDTWENPQVVGAQNDYEFDPNDFARGGNLFVDGGFDEIPWRKFNISNFGNTALGAAFSNFMNRNNYSDISNLGWYFTDAGKPTVAQNLTSTPMQNNTAPSVSGPSNRTALASGTDTVGGYYPAGGIWSPMDLVIAGYIGSADELRKKDTPLPRVENPLTQDQRIAVDNPHIFHIADTGLAGQTPIERYNANKQDEKLSSEVYPTWPRYAGAIGSGLMALQNLLEEPDEYKLNPVAPVLPQGTLRLQRERYNPLDMNMLANQMQAQNQATARSLRNAGLGPSTGATLLATDYNGNQNMGNALTQVWDANNQRRNAVIAANNDAALKEAQFYQNLDQIRANTINEFALRNQYNNLMLQQLNNNAESQKWNAVSQNLGNALSALSDIGYENLNRNMADSNTALYYGSDRRGKANYKGFNCGGTLLKKHKK